MAIMLKVVILTSEYTGSGARIIDYLANSLKNKINIVGIIYDERKESDRKRQLKRIKAWNKRGGFLYVVWRLWLNFRLLILYTRNKMSYAKNLDNLSKFYGISIFRVPNINSKYSEDTIRSLSPDLGISLGNRIIEERIFSIPSLGMINLHHGKIPFYRGTPPYFWEIYNGESYTGVSVHRIDDEIDHGGLLAQKEVKIEKEDDTKILFEKALSIDYKLVEEVLNMFCSGNIKTIPVDFSLGKVYTYPSYYQVRELERRKKKKIDPLGYICAEVRKVHWIII